MQFSKDYWREKQKVYFGAESERDSCCGHHVIGVAQKIQVEKVYDTCKESLLLVYLEK